MEQADLSVVGSETRHTCRALERVIIRYSLSSLKDEMGVIGEEAMVREKGSIREVYNYVVNRECHGMPYQHCLRVCVTSKSGIWIP